MKSRYAILLDGGFIIKKLEKRLGNFPTADDIVKEGERIRNNAQITSYSQPPVLGVYLILSYY